MTSDHPPTSPAPDLLPCPFCGSAVTTDGKSETLRIRCLDCGVQGPIFEFDPDDDKDIENAQIEAIESWNRRPSPGEGKPTAGACIESDWALWLEGCDLTEIKHDGTHPAFVQWEIEGYPQGFPRWLCRKVAAMIREHLAYPAPAPLAELTELLNAGNAMSNICFNIGQGIDFDQDWAKITSDAQKRWDAARTAYFNATQPSPTKGTTP